MWNLDHHPFIFSIKQGILLLYCMWHLVWPQSCVVMWSPGGSYDVLDIKGSDSDVKPV